MSYISKYINLKSFNDKELYKRFKYKYGADSDISSLRSLKKALTRIESEINETIVEHDEGVLLKGIGYLAIMRYPFPVVKKELNEQYADKIEDRYIYHPILIPYLFKKDYLKGFISDFSFSDKLKRRMSKKIKSGFKYKFRYTLAKELAKNI
jgi:hypothetical protein